MTEKNKTKNNNSVTYKGFVDRRSKVVSVQHVIICDWNLSQVQEDFFCHRQEIYSYKYV